MPRYDQPRPCAIDGCGRPRHGCSDLCAAHKARKLRGQPLSPPVRGYSTDPEQVVSRACASWYESLARQRRRLDQLLQGDGQLATLGRSIVALEEADAEDDAAWERAQNKWLQALSRYAKAKRSKKRKG
jgi:hypothetical protein